MWPDERDEQRSVRDLEEAAARPDQEGDGVQLGHPEGAEPVCDGDGGDEERAADVGGDHDVSTVPPPIHPDTGDEGENEVWRKPGRGQVAHLGRRRVEHEHGEQWQREQRDLVADERDRGRAPVPAEHPFPQEGPGRGLLLRCLRHRGPPWFPASGVDGKTRWITRTARLPLGRSSGSRLRGTNSSTIACRRSENLRVSAAVRWSR